jgi:WD40 repeat protein
MGRSREISGHRGEVTAISFTPDGCQLLSSSYDGTICLWDSKTGEEIRRFSQPHQQSGRALDAKISPTGRVVLGITDAQFLYLWEAANGALIARLPTRGGYRACFSPDGRFLLVKELITRRVYREDLLVIEVATGSQLLSLPMSVPAVAWGFSWNGGQILSAHVDGTVVRWAAATGTQLEQSLLPFDAPAGRVMEWSLGSAAFSPDGRSLCLSRTISYGETPTCEALQLVYLGLDPMGQAQVVVSDRHPGSGSWYRAVALSYASNARLLVAGPDELLRLWDLGSQVEQYRCEAKETCCLAFSPDALFAASGTRDGALHVWALPEP